MKVEYKFDPFKITGIDDDGLTKSQKSEILEDIANLVLESVINDVGESVSPVTGKRFKALSSDYKKAKISQGGTPVANLELSGSMLDSLRVKISGNSLVLTVSPSEMPKADNHNKFSDESKETNVPARKFIPNAENKESFREEIINEIRVHIEDKIDEFSG